MLMRETELRLDPERAPNEIDLALLDAPGGSVLVDAEKATAKPPVPESPAPLDPVRGQGQVGPGAPGLQEGSSREPEEGRPPLEREGKIRVLVVDDHRAVRQAFAFSLNNELDIEVIGEAGDGLAALEQIRQLHPDVVLMDINMPGMNGIEATRRIHAEFPHIQVIGLSMYEGHELGAAMQNAGARAYVSKSESYDSLLAAIRACRESEPK
ncbi:MAG TPA: response regulator transcription factor [Candidatus Methylomirabilis sp.]|nr:response regulator transcription factor [Candidatus Methylomirabilis sp.]